MSTSSVSSATNTAINTSGGLTSTSTLTNNGANGSLQITGLASGINTNALIQAELQIEEAPLTNMQNEISGLKAQNTTLSSIQTALQQVSGDAMMLAEPSTFFNVQTISSSNTALITAQTSASVGAPVGSTTLAVSQLAAAAQTAFSYTPPSSGSETLSISDGVNPASTISVAAGTTTAALASQINHANNLTVWAAVSSTGQLVLSSRSTGSQYSVSASDQDTPGNLVTQTTQAGQDAQYTINGVPGASGSDTVTGAIPGVTLNLLGVTGSTPVTITAAPPGPSASTITSMVQQFVTDYNSALSSIESAVNTEPSNTATGGTYNPNSGSLFGDDELVNLIGKLRDSIIAPGAGLPTGLAALSDLGVSTGASTGQATTSGVNGVLTLNTTTLQNALSSNPGGVAQVIQSWAASFQSLTDNEAGPGGNLANRINGNTSETTQLQTEYTDKQALYNQQEVTMQAQWAAVEGALSTLHSQNTYLTAFASSLSSSSSSSKS